MDRMISAKFIHQLGIICPNRVGAGISLAQLSSWQIGGIADCIVEPACIEELQQVIKVAKEEGIPKLVFGSGTNLLFADEGLRALGIRIGKHMAKTQIEGNTVTVGAGAWVPMLARKIGKAGLAGAEHIVGIPGTIGGLVCMNGGSARKNIGENVLSVTCVDSEGCAFEMSNSECEFSYRSSVFKQEKIQVIISRVDLNFPERGNPREIKRKMLKILAERNQKFPRKLPNCGSVFLSEPEMHQEIGPPGSVIEKCGLKGLRVGGAEVSTKHANFIVNVGGATAQDMVTLIGIIQKKVLEKTGFMLKTEVQYVSDLGTIFSSLSSNRLSGKPL